MRLRSDDNKSRRHDLDEDRGRIVYWLLDSLNLLYGDSPLLSRMVECVASKCFSHVV